ncbi:unnamed protein product [Vitrella brassicaformis CCMP3155]|uniref:Uncharacterized protein n=1 Tax=Vitrella brassicaformis (strain CCMP3155) TaxID=1169540 RepID=A0A0G4F9Q8_VITBC|nr:unnamed protein product [Vitrella brassicaformis CCMP3155]|eukprot:CEM09001.1 unnamed protein product [Vitrella brassicaformis CCMP3155]
MQDQGSWEGFQADIDAKTAREKKEKRSRAEHELENYDGGTCFYFTHGGSVSQNCGGGLVCVVGTRTPEEGRRSGKCMHKEKAKDKYCHGAPVKRDNYGRYSCQPFKEGTVA